MRTRSFGTPVDFPSISRDRASIALFDPLDSRVTLHARSYGSHTPSRLFELLDGSHIRAGERACRITVYSVHEVGNRFWIQLSVGAGGERPLVVSLSRRVGVDELLEAIQDWAVRPETSDGVLRVGI